MFRSVGELAQSQNSIGGKVVKLYLECLEDYPEEVNRRDAKAARKEILKDNSLIKLQTGNCFTTRNPTLPY
jgi:hypothetical protein